MQKTKSIGFRVTKEEKEQIQDLAAEQNISVSELLYDIVMNWVKWIKDEDN